MYMYRAMRLVLKIVTSAGNTRLATRDDRQHSFYADCSVQTDARANDKSFPIATVRKLS